MLSLNMLHLLAGLSRAVALTTSTQGLGKVVHEQRSVYGETSSKVICLVLSRHFDIVTSLDEAYE